MITIQKWIIILSFLVALTALQSCTTEESEERPNFIFIYTDDQSYETIAALGNDEIITPHLDQLVKDGTTFTHAYNMGGWHGAICVASRSMLISGKSIWRAKAEGEKWRSLDQRSISSSWPKLLSEVGYDTYMTGKWHIPLPVDSAFHEVQGFRPGGMPDSHWQHRDPDTNEKNWSIEKVSEALEKGQSTNLLFPKGYGRPIDENDNRWSASDTTDIGYWDGGQHWSEALRDEAFEFLDKASHDDDPFFMYLAFNAPHDPRQAPQEFLDLYPVEDIDVPENFKSEYPYKDEIENSVLLRDEALAPMPRTRYSVQKNRQEYYAIISHLDEQIGMILDKAKKLDQLDNTYIIFTSDHGLSVGHHGLIGKQNMYDHSMRVPFIICGPDIPRGKKIDHDIYLQDAGPTVLELAGIDIPDHVEYHSLVDHIQGLNDEPIYPAIYGAYVSSQRMIRKDGFKLLAYPNAQKLLLFDLENDPEEMTDLAELSEYRDKVKELFGDLLLLQEDMDDPLNLEEVFKSYL